MINKKKISSIYNLKIKVVFFAFKSYWIEKFVDLHNFVKYSYLPKNLVYVLWAESDWHLKSHINFGMFSISIHMLVNQYLHSHSVHIAELQKHLSEQQKVVKRTVFNTFSKCQSLFLFSSTTKTSLIVKSSVVNVEK